MFNSTQQERLDGYKGALKKYDIPILDNRIIFGNGKIEGYLDQKNGESYKLARKMMQDDEITAYSLLTDWQLLVLLTIYKSITIIFREISQLLLLMTLSGYLCHIRLSLLWIRIQKS